MTIPISRLMVLKERLQSDDDALIKKTLKELDRGEITFDLLKETGIGIPVNKLRHHDNLGSMARGLVSKWKQCAADDDSEPELSTPRKKAAHSSSRHSEAVRNHGYHAARSPSPIAKKPKVDNHKRSESTKKHKNRPERCDEDNEIFTVNSGSFEQILGLNDSTQRQQSTPSKNYVKSVKRDNDWVAEKRNGGEMRSTNRNVAVMDYAERKPNTLSTTLHSVDWSKVLPEKLATDYRPQSSRPILYDFEEDAPRRGNGLDNMDDLDFSEMKNRKLTKVYSGRRKGNVGTLQEVPRLDESCIRVLRDNVEVLKYANSLPPFHFVTRVLERATPSQLYEIEDWNPRLLEDTSDLWQAHCERDFKGVAPDWEEGETWRELYERMLAERDKKLDKLKHAIAEQKAAKEGAVRQAKMAMAKAPREVRRRQMKYGTYKKETLLPEAGDVVQSRRNLDLNPGAKGSTRTFSHIYDDEQRQKDQPKHRKAAVAPLMAKSLKMMKRNRVR